MSDNTTHRIRQNFNRSARTYDENCHIQNFIAEQALELLGSSSASFKTIADFGCGTGQSTRRLIQFTHFEHCYAVDMAEYLIRIGKKKLAHHTRISWLSANFETPLAISNTFELIFSNMALQWSHNTHKTISLWQHYLKHHGLLLFSIPITGNFPEIQSAYKLSLISHNHVTEILKPQNNWQIIAKHVISIQTSFASQLDLLKSLKVTGTNYSKQTKGHHRGLSTLKLNQIFTKPDNKDLTYRVGIYLARKIK